MSQMRCSSVRRLWMMFQGSRPSTSRITPIRIDSRISRKMTESGGPPKKRLMASVLVGRWPAVGRSDGMLIGLTLSHGAILGAILGAIGLARFVAVVGGAASGLDLVQHLLERLQPVGLARRLVPAQPADAGKAHRKPGFVAGRTLQPFEGDLEHQALVGLVHDLAHRAETLDGVAADETVDLDQLLVGEAEIG